MFFQDRNGSFIKIQALDEGMNELWFGTILLQLTPLNTGLLQKRHYPVNVIVNPHGDLRLTCRSHTLRPSSDRMDERCRARRPGPRMLSPHRTNLERWAALHVPRRSSLLLGHGAIVTR